MSDSTPAISWLCKTFDELNLTQLYALLALRQQVFVVEQQCAYQDADGEDDKAIHLMGYAGASLVAYARIFHASGQASAHVHGASANEHRIGRVIVAPQLRGQQLGREIMRRAMTVALQASQHTDIVVGAQRHLVDFYSSLGFSSEGAPYLEDGIPHQDMRYRAAHS